MTFQNPSSRIFYTLCCLVTLVKPHELLESHQAVISALKSGNYSSNLVPQPLLQPNESASRTPLKVFINLGLRDIENIDDRQMELKTQLSLRLKWLDPRLEYSSNDPNEYVTLNSDISYKPWTPDIFVGNEKSSVVHNIIRPNSFLRIYPNGSIYYSSRVSLTVSCLMDFTRFPFDRQKCELLLASYGYTQNAIELQWDTDTNLELVNEIRSHHLTQFRLIGQAIGRCVKKTSAGEFSAVYVQLGFKRQLAYYNIQVFLPCTMLTMITWVSFWLGNALEARLSLTVTVLLTMATQLAGANQALSHISYTTGFSVFSGTCLTFACLSIFQAATVFYIQGEGRRYLRIWRQKKVRNTIKENKDEERGDPEINDEVKPTSRDSMMDASAEKIDKISRILFPFVFLLFLAIYFGTFVWGIGLLDEELLVHVDGYYDGLKDYNKTCQSWNL